MSEECGVRAVKYNASHLIEVLGNFNIKFTLQDLKGNNMDKVIDTYKVFLKSCINVDEAMFETYKYEITSNFSDETMAIHKTAFKRIQFYSFVFILLDICGLKGYISEVYFPHLHGKNTFQKQLNTVINFAHFEYTQLPDFFAIQEEYKTKSKEVNEIQTKNTWYKSQIATFKQDKNEKRIPIENTKKRIAALIEKTGQVVAHKKKVEEELAKWEKELANIETEKEEALNRINTNQKRTQFLDKMLIKSPEKLRKDIDKNKLKITDTNKVLQIKKEEIEQLSKTYSEREKFLDGLEIVTESLETFYQNDMQNSNKMMKEIELDNEEKINKEFEVQQLSSKISTQVAEKEKKQKDYETTAEMIEKEMLVLNNKDQTYETEIKKLEAKIKAIEKSIIDAKSEHKSNIEQFKTHMAREANAMEWIQKQREGLEVKRRVFDEIHNQMRAGFIKRSEKELVGCMAEDEGYAEMLKLMKLT